MPKIMCQLCGKMGHVAMKCYHRFDITFVDNSHSHEINDIVRNKSAKGFIPSNQTNKSHML